MKMICIGRNYALHAKELGNLIPEEPVVFIKSDNAVLQKNEPFYLPDLGPIHYEAELIFRVSKSGKHIDPAFALSYIDSFSVGIDFTARELQQKLKDKKRPWELAKSFDNSAVLGKWKDLAEYKQNDCSFFLKKNGEFVQHGNSQDMLFTLENIIAFVSKYFTLKIGDILFTGTPEGVGEVKIGDQLRAGIGNESLLDFKVK